MSETENPWKTLDITNKYENPWIRVEEHNVLNPAGNPGIYGKVCAKGKAVGVVVLDDFANIWLVGQYRYPIDAYSWEIPEGAGEKHEDPLDTAKRELKEETGLTAKDWQPLMRLHTSNCVSDEEASLFLARNVEEGEANPEETELLTVRKMPFPQVLDMILNGEITDAMSVAGILKVAQLNLAGKRVEILYQDEYCAAVYKPPGLLVHRTSMSRDREFLLQRVRNQIKKKLDPIHRLDKPASGIVLFGLDSEATSKFAELFRTRNVKKTYLAVVRGFADPKGIIDHPLKNHLKDDVEQEALTEYETLDTSEIPIPVGPYEKSRYSLVKVDLKTGRMHQIRRHFNHISHPVIGDTSYGDRFHNRMFKDEFHCRRLLLFAWKLEFTHPFTGENIEIVANLDPEFEEILETLNLHIHSSRGDAPR